MVDPPEPGDASFSSFTQEEDEIFHSLKRRAKILVDGLNSIDGIKCEPAEGALYTFPAVEIPPKAVQKAEEELMSPDTLYALSLLEEEGICVVPASGFGQREGRYGFRTTILPQESEIKDAIKGFRRHHKFFCEKYA